MLAFHQADHTDEAVIRELFWEYLQWVNANLHREYDVSLNIAAILEEDMLKLDKFYPPKGKLLLARSGDETVGMACLRQITQTTGEVKRMYVRPAFRRSGAGRALLSSLIEEARGSGYKQLRLDSARFMQSAHALYQSAGFRAIEPYPESEVPKEFQLHWVFMELSLTVRSD